MRELVPPARNEFDIEIALSDAEILELYRRGANRIKYQARTCSDASCTAGAPDWLGPDGTNQTYFSELYNTASNALTSAVQEGPPNMLFSNFTSGGFTVPDNRYFQYRAIMESDDGNQLCDYGSGPAPCSPELKSVSIGPNHYDKTSPTVSNSTGVSFNTLATLVETLEATNGCKGSSVGTNALQYSLSPDHVTWYYWTGAAWGISDGTYVQTSSANSLNSHLASFSAQAGSGSFYFKAYLHSDGLTPCELDDLAVTGTQ